MRGTDFANLRAFMMIVETGSFAKAALVLGIAPSTLSYTIQSLEQRLGMTLLYRTTRKVVPTEAGVRLSRKLGPMLLDFDALMEDLTAAREKPAGILKLCIPRMPMRLHMESILASFEAAFPDITIDLTIGDFVRDIASSGFDAGVLPNRNLADDIVAIPLTGQINRIVYAAPKYLSRFGTPATPADLKDHNCINFRGPLTGEIYNWEFHRDGNRFEVAVKGNLIVSDITFSLSAALNGRGIGYGLDAISKSYVDEGSLVSILVDWSVPHPGFVLCYPKARHVSAAMNALVSHIRRHRIANTQHSW